MTSKRKLYNLALNQPLNWLILCVANPSPYMSKTHVLILKAVIRRKQNEA